MASRATLSSVSLGRTSTSLAPRTIVSFSAANNPQRSSDDTQSRKSAMVRPSLALQPQPKYLWVSRASFSSKKEEEKSEGMIRGYFSDRAERQEQEKYMEQMTRFSTMEVFTMKEYRKELQDGIDGGGVMTKISFMQTKEIKQAKEVVDVVDKIIEVVGPEATAEDLIQMDRLQRLKVANAANRTLEEISIMVSQITNMDVMQKTLRKRYLEGKPIPPDKDAMQAVIQKDALSVLSKSQKEMMKSRQESNARRMARKKRRGR